MSFDAQRLLQLLPQVYRIRDAERAASNGAGPLESLLAVLGEQLSLLEEDLEQLYDDHFIETCAEWVVPYIGDLIGYRGLHGISDSVARSRAEVAHTIALRRRKGTLAALEQLAFDVTGWRASGAEFFQRVITTQYMNHVRKHITVPDLRKWEPLERIGTAFDKIPRTVDVRRIEPRRGRHNLPNIGLFVWRLQACSLTHSPAAKLDTRRYRFHPLGIDQPLFTRAATERELTDLAGPLNVPIPISRRVLEADLAADESQYYSHGDLLLSLCVYLNRADGAGLVAVPPKDVCSCHLGGDDVAWAHLPPTGKVAIDPVLGRLALPPDATDDWRVLVDFHYGFPANMGGGEYERGESFVDTPPLAQVIQVPDDRPTVQQAIDDLNGNGVVEITNSGRYEEALGINAAPGGRVEIRAANHVRPTIVLTSEWVLEGGDESEIRLNGLLVAGHGLRVTAGGLARLSVVHCTLVPGRTLASDLTPPTPAEPSLTVEAENFDLTLQRSICGPLRAPDGAAVSAADCAIDATTPDAVAYCAPDGSPGAALTLNACTVVGSITARALPLVSNCILLANAPAAGAPPVRAEFRQDGCIRFTWLPPTSRTPRRHRCLPESADSPYDAVPRFTSFRYGHPAYLQLSILAGPRLLTGADGEAEPGVYHHLRGAWRETNLRVRLDEYLRVGLQAGIFYEN